MVAPASSSSSKPSAKARDLFRFICALSSACERDNNVLRDGQLVDRLELEAKEILRARRQNTRSASICSTISSRLSTSPVLSAAAPPAKMSKRRKLPSDTGKSPMMYPSLPAVYDMDKASLYMAHKDGSSSLVPSVKIEKIDRRGKKLSPHVGPIGVGSYDVVVNHVAVTSDSPRSMMEHLSLDKASLSPSRPARESLDFEASMVSTVSSSSMPHFDMLDLDDPGTLTPMARYSSAPHTYEYDDYSPGNLSTELHVSELGSAGRSCRKDSCYSETTTSSLNDRATPKKLRFEMDALSLYEKDGAAMSHMSSASLKNLESGLVETLQSQVDLLLSENVKALAENARLTEISKMSACEAEDFAAEKRRIEEQIKYQKQQLIELENKLQQAKKRADAQEVIRREAEVAFQTELDAKNKVVSSLQDQVEAKDAEIAQLTKRAGLVIGDVMPEQNELCSSTASIQGSSTDIMTELQKMRSLLLEKDREICNLYMHLSTKKNLIEEITKKFVQHMEEVAAAAKTGGDVAASISTEGVRFDLDMFLFKNVVDKQRRMEELTAALGVMDREVESLEARVAAKELENKRLRENQSFLAQTLQSVNAQVFRIQKENERLDQSLQEKQDRIAALTSSLDEKEREVTHLSEQVRLAQVDDNDKSRRSLSKSFFKSRSSLSSSALKGSSVQATRMSKRSSVFSDVFDDISVPVGGDEESLFGMGAKKDVELFNELFSTAA